MSPTAKFDQAVKFPDEVFPEVKKPNLITRDTQNKFEKRSSLQSPAAGVKLKKEFNELMKFSLDQDITIFNARLDQLKKQQLKVRDYFKNKQQTSGEQQQGGGILKSIHDVLPFLDSGGLSKQGQSARKSTVTNKHPPKVRFRLEGEDNDYS